MNRLQRRNQRVVAKALRTPVLITSINVTSDRLIDVQTATWDEYWDGCDCMAEELRRLHEAWSDFIEGGYSAAQRAPFVQAYFALLRTCLEGHTRSNVDLAALEKVVGFETLSICCRDGRLAEHRNRFTTVTLLTKNPALLMDDRYVQALHRLGELPCDHPRRALFDAEGHPPLRLECSLAFFNDEHRRLLDPAAPAVESRMEAMRFLRKEGLAVFPRIDPLFPHDPLGGGKRMADFGLPDVQSMCDLDALVSFGRELAARHIIYSAAKITRPKQGTLPTVMERMKRVYQHLSAGQPLVFHGGSWRLSEGVAAAVVLKPFLELCGRYSIPAKPCKTNLVTTP